MNIGILLPYLKSRGTEKQALGLAKGFQAKGAKVFVFILQGWGLESMYQAFHNAGVEIKNIGEPANVGTKEIDPVRQILLEREVQKAKCDLILSRANLTHDIALKAGKKINIPVFCVLSTSLENEKFKGIIKWLKRKKHLWNLKKKFMSATGIISVSQENAERFSAFVPALKSKVYAIRNGVDYDTVSSKASEETIAKKEEKFVISYCGSIELKRKGFDVLIDAAEKLQKSKPEQDFIFWIVGAGEDADFIKDIIKEKGLVSNFVFWGEQSNPHPILKFSDVFVLPSRKEGMPNALLEAMSLGLCCISSDCETGPREIIIPNENGILFHVGDGGALAEKLLVLMQNEKQRKVLADQAKRTIVEHWSYQKMIDGYWNLFLGKLGKRK